MERQRVVVANAAQCPALRAEARRLRDEGAEVIVTGASLTVPGIVATAVGEDAAEVVVAPQQVARVRRALADLGAEDIAVRGLEP